jgi:excisionase family DNA binding protein
MMRVKEIRPMAATPHELTIPTERDARLAGEASRTLDASGGIGQSLTMQIVKAGKKGAALELPPIAAALLKTMLKEMAAGRAVTIVPIDAEITTQQAAEILHVSRPFVVGLIDKGELPARMVGAHRRVLLDDVLAFKRASKTKARAALKEMVAISQELGLE